MWAYSFHTQQTFTNTTEHDLPLAESGPNLSRRHHILIDLASCVPGYHLLSMTNPFVVLQILHPDGKWSSIFAPEPSAYRCGLLSQVMRTISKLLSDIKPGQQCKPVKRMGLRPFSLLSIVTLHMMQFDIWQDSNTGVRSDLTDGWTSYLSCALSLRKFSEH